MIKQVKLAASLLFAFFSLAHTSSYAQQFKFAFLTDLHANVDSTFTKINKVLTGMPADVNFIITGGDNVDVDNLSIDKMELASARFTQLKKLLAQTGKPYYLTVGNHDRLPAFAQTKQNPFEAFEQHFGATYYTFDYENYRFIVLNSVYNNQDGDYFLPNEEVNWLTDLLKNTATDKPIILITHVPLITVYFPFLHGKYIPKETVANQFQLLNLFKSHQLKLVLQGHTHFYEEIKVKNIQFITAGAISGFGWKGGFNGTKQGYLLLSVDGDQIHWEYQTPADLQAKK